MALRRGGAAPSQTHGTTQQDNKLSPSLPPSLPPPHLPFFLSLHLSAYLFPSASESGNRNLKAASSFHILSALPLIALDTPTAFTWLNRLKASFLSVCVFWVGLFSCHLHRTYDAGS